MNTFIRLALLAFLCAALAHAQNKNWPQFRGPNSSGIADRSAKPPLELNEHNTTWKISLPVGYSSPCIWGSNIFVTGFVEDQKELQLICINRNTGAINWRYAAHPEKIETLHSTSNPSVTTSVTDGEIVCAYWGSYGLVCVNMKGKLLWEARMPAAGEAEGICTSPIIAGQKIIFIQLGNDNPHIVALHRANGDTLWQTSLPNVSIYGADNHSTPIVWKDQIILHRKGEIVAHSIETGKRLWWVSSPTKGVSTPVMGKDKLYVGCWSNFADPGLRLAIPDFRAFLKQSDKNADGLIAKDEIPNDMMFASRAEIVEIEAGQLYVRKFLGMIDANKDDQIDEEEWKQIVSFITSFYMDTGLLAIKPDGSGDVTLSHVLWTEKKAVPEVPSPIYFNGRLYMVKDGGLITCMDAESGRVLFRERLGAPGQYTASPIIARDKIYIASGRGVITVIATTDQFQILAQNDLKEEIYATPAVFGNSIYVRTTKYLYAFRDDAN